jgi:cellulose synthase/poly-beta-1,6-N-acetylglucosamine synthase-like glycosyltransferase
VVTIITCTIRPGYFKNLLNNYKRQRWRNKELIIILNKNSMSLRKYKRKVRKYKRVRVYKLPQRYTLGRCLNYAIRRARGNIIAKFDDDDFYGARYLRESVRAIKRGKASIVGKHTSYIYFEAKKALMLFRTGRQNKYVKRVKGGTLVFKKKVWKKVKFSNKKVAGSDARWLTNCRKKGYRIYSVSKKNYVCIRRKNTNSHTQKRSTKKYMSRCKMVKRTRNYRKYVTR